MWNEISPPGLSDREGQGQAVPKIIPGVEYKPILSSAFFPCPLLSVLYLLPSVLYLLTTDH
jgi:hypothetical protein